MAWNTDHLAPVETLLFRSALVKAGYFQCAPDHPCFPLLESLDNDVFVLPRRALWVRRNAGEFRFAEPGSILMHRAGSTLERRRANEIGEQTIWFGVYPTVFIDALQRHHLSTEEMGGALIADPKLRYRLALLVKRLQSESRDAMEIEERILNLFFQICEQRSESHRASRGVRSGTATRRRKLVDNARAYLEEHLTETVALEDVAHAAGTSLYHLCRVFREETGLTMHAYRTQQRIGRVLDRLVDGSMENFSDIAFEFGFSSHSHLCRQFQKQMGVSPSSFRSAH